MEEFIVLEDVHKTYGKGENAFEALKGISLVQENLVLPISLAHLM